MGGPRPSPLTAAPRPRSSRPPASGRTLPPRSGKVATGVRPAWPRPGGGGRAHAAGVGTQGRWFPASLCFHLSRPRGGRGAGVARGLPAAAPSALLRPAPLGLAGRGTHRPDEISSNHLNADRTALRKARPCSPVVGQPGDGTWSPAAPRGRSSWCPTVAVRTPSPGPRPERAAPPSRPPASGRGSGPSSAPRLICRAPRRGLHGRVLLVSKGPSIQGGPALSACSDRFC